MLYNADVQRQNETIELLNRSREEVDKVPLMPYIDAQGYADKVIVDAANTFYQQMIDLKKDEANRRFFIAPPEIQAQVMALLEVPDVLPS